MVTKNPCILLMKHCPILSRIGCVLISNAIIQSQIQIPSIPHFIVMTRVNTDGSNGNDNKITINGDEDNLESQCSDDDDDDDH